MTFDASKLKNELKSAATLSRQFSRMTAPAFTDAASRGQSLSSTLRKALKSRSPIAFARGGILTGASHFALPSGRMGLAGEAGPEAVLPLQRGPDGRLGVSTGASRQRPIQVTFNISTPDVEGFRRSQGQISAQILRVLQDGKRNL